MQSPGTATAARRESKAKPTKNRKTEIDELLTYSDERCHGIIRSHGAKALPLPVVGYELPDDKAGSCRCRTGVAFHRRSGGPAP